MNFEGEHNMESTTQGKQLPFNYVNLKLQMLISLTSYWPESVHMTISVAGEVGETKSLSG